MAADPLFLTDAQLRSELARCEFCEDKPCQEACPAHCSPADFIMAARLGQPADFGRAAGLIFGANPFGGICGSVCPDSHCQAACVHVGFDKYVEIPSIQSAIIARARLHGTLPPVAETELDTGHRVAVVGAGPAGLSAALELAQQGHRVDLLERDGRAGGACTLIPTYRLPHEVLFADVDQVLAHSRVDLLTGVEVEDPAALLDQGYGAVVVAIGRHRPYALGVPGEERAVAGNPYLATPDRWPATGRVAVVGGGAIATDCAVVARLQGAAQVEMIALEKWSELPLTPVERAHLVEHGVEITGRTRVVELRADGALVVRRVQLAAEVFSLDAISDVPGSDQVLPGYDLVITAIGNGPELPAVDHPRVRYAGDCAVGASTVITAVASGKNIARQVGALLAEEPVPSFEARKSRIIIPGWAPVPVPLEVDFFGRPLPSPLLLSAAPPTDGHEQMRLAFEAGWAGGIMKTAFDGLPIHIPADYMHVFDGLTYGNCDNVSGHALDRMCREIEQLTGEWPDRLVAGSTGGPVTGDDAADRLVWQSNGRKLEAAGAGAIEYSLSCPQGGDGTEGDIVSQSASVTAKIVDWIMATADPEVPRLFKLTGAVTSIAVIVAAIREVLDRYPEKKAGVTLANTFPTLMFRAAREGGPLDAPRKWDQGIVVGMSGAGVAPISNLSLASVSHLGVTVSGNGGPMDYLAAAHFLALGARTVQFCTVAMKYGLGIVDELHSGLSHLLQARGFASVEELIGAALVGGPITDFMDLTAVKRISQPDHLLCTSCGNCTRCSYLAISLDERGLPWVDPARCVGCSLCVQKCFAGALHMRDRSSEELAVLRED